MKNNNSSPISHLNTATSKIYLMNRLDLSKRLVTAEEYKELQELFNKFEVNIDKDIKNQSFKRMQES